MKAKKARVSFAIPAFSIRPSQLASFTSLATTSSTQGAMEKDKAENHQTILNTIDPPGDEPAETCVDDMSLDPGSGSLHTSSTSSRLTKVVGIAHRAHQLVMVVVIMIAHRAHQLRCLWVVVSWAGLTSVGDAGGERVVELGAEAEVGVEEVEEEVEGALFDQVGDEPEIKIFCRRGRATDHLNCFLSVQSRRVSRAIH